MNLDFSVAAPGGVAAGHPAALAARGADPSLAVPGGNHFFRRIADLTLAPIPGALVPAPTLVPQSIVDLVLTPAVTTAGAANVRTLSPFLHGILSCAQIEVGIGQRAIAR